MKPGRNDPCGCGSGKKFKYCCLNQTQQIGPQELIWRRVRRATDQLIGALMREAVALYGPEAQDWAWDDFCLYDEQPYDPEDPVNQIFLSWFIYDWVPEFEDDAGSVDAAESTVAQSYLERVGRRLEPMAQQYLRTCCAAPFSFHEVLDARPGNGFVLRDIMLGSQIDVVEKRGSEHARVGDILYGKVVPIEGIGIVEALAPYAMQPDRKLRIIELRRQLAAGADLLDAAVLRERADELRALYFEFAEELMHPQVPRMQNTDGDPIEMHTLIFEIDAPDAAFEALRDLALDMSDEDFAQAAERDGTGRLVRAELTWAKSGNAMHKEWDNTSLGRIFIESDRLTAEVNSANRAATLRDLIEKRLGDSARERPSVVRSMQQLVEQGRSERTSESEEPAPQGQNDDADLAQDPQVRAAVRETLRQHYKGWIDDKLPALGGRSPREAVRDPDGREAVEALVMQIERTGERMQPPMDGELIVELRRNLGLREAI